MNVKPLALLCFTLASASAVSAQVYENAQIKAQQEQLKREAEAQQAVIQADIARNPNGKNAQEARRAAEAAKALAAEKEAADLKAEADLKANAEAATAKAEKDRKESEAQWAAGAAERERAAAAKKAAIEKWRASAKPAPSIMMGRRPDGTFTVIVDGKVSTFATAAEAQAFMVSARKAADTTLSY